MKYKRLNTLLYDKGVKKKAVAQQLNISTKALSNKILGISKFTWNEACIIQKEYFPNMSKDDIFLENHDEAS